MHYGEESKVMVRRGMRLRRLALAALGAGFLAFGAAACGTDSSSGSGGGDGESTGPLELGYTATLSGEFASYGEEMENGVRLAIDEINREGGINGQQIELTVEDDQGKPANGPVVAQKFCDDEEISAVLGYSFSSVALAAIPVYTQCGLPVLGSAVTSPELSGASEYFFRNSLSDRDQGRQMGEYAVKVLGLERIAVLNQKDDFGIGTSNGFIEGVESSGGEIVSRDEYQLGTKSFDSQLAAIRNKNPDAIYVGGFYAETARIAIQARDLGIDVQILGTDGVQSPDLLDLGGDAVEGVYYYGVFSPKSDAPGVAEFVEAYEKEYGVEPTSWAALAYDAVYTIQAAIEESGDSSREGIKAGLEAVSYEGVTGPATFNEDGDREGTVTFLKVQNGDFGLAEEQLSQDSE